jgi:hypothetical protein
MRNSTGGISWHWLAWRHQNLWKPTTLQIEHALKTHSTKATVLIVIGASAGWMMPTSWLVQFEKIITIDIDPLAGWLFKTRHGSALSQAGRKLSHLRGDGLLLLSQLKRTYPDALFWFDNVLGQLRFLADRSNRANETQQRISQLKLQLKNCEWGSLHDRYSGAVNPNQTTQLAAWLSPSPVDLSSENGQQWLRKIGAKGAWLDHLTQDVFAPGTQVANIFWPFRKDYGHWLELGFAPTNDGARPCPCMN